ncbi:hypothetical protein Q5O14_18000 [Eubacteriaceae bacterium ES2]|nr:hypothetical protein Q5O14_18000 [Eubacteriaceae bacterium ES2]
MALNYGIFESEFVGLDTDNVPMYDRAVDETFLELYCGGFFTDGVAVFVENCFQVISELDNQITVNPGIALLEGKMAYDLLSDTISLPDSPTTYSRYDRVVLRRDNVARTISIEFVSGEENAAPVEPDLTRTENVYELSLATILRSPSDIVTQANITDDRLNTSLCGVIGPKTNVLDTEDLFAQFTAVFNEMQSNYSSSYEAWRDSEQANFTTWRTDEQSIFNAWFLTIQNTLDGDTAGNLLNLITANTDEISAINQNLWKLTDDSTSVQYEFGILDGALYYKEVTE